MRLTFSVQEGGAHKMTKRNKTMGDTQVCARCRRMFTYSGFGHRYCEVCKEYDAADFEKVRSYIYEHGRATMIELSEATKVEINVIEQYLREGRLEIPEDSNIFIHCELCNAEIRSGRYCRDCAIQLSKNFVGILDEYEIGEKAKRVENKGKMYFLNKNKK